MTKLVEDIIDLTQLDNGGAEANWDDCNLYTIAGNAVESLTDTASDKDVEISIEGEASLMKGIPHMLYSIVYNLCDNAIKYNCQGGSVKVIVTHDDLNTILRVADTGVGIPQDSLNRIFERFYRVDKSHSKEVGGTGLGLSIVKHAVNIHNGNIEVHSDLGKGTEFVVNFPNSY